MADQDRQPHSELASFGEELRREREIRGISLKEISDATKISKRFLEAIERNDHKTLPAPVFTRGFVREYARYLGLSVEEIVNRYNFAAAGDDRIEKTAHLERLVESQSPERPQPSRGIPPPYARIDRNVYLLVVIVVALLGVAWWAFRHKTHAEPDLPRSVESNTAPVVIARPTPPPATAGAGGDSGSVGGVYDGLHLTIDVAEASVIILESDGVTVINDELKKGEHHTFDARDRFRLKTVGNAAGVRLTLNGIAIPALGGEGQVVHDRVYDREALQHLTATGHGTVAASPR